MAKKAASTAHTIESASRELQEGRHEIFKLARTLRDACRVRQSPDTRRQLELEWEEVAREMEKRAAQQD